MDSSDTSGEIEVPEDYDEQRRTAKKFLEEDEFVAFELTLVRADGSAQYLTGGREPGYQGADRVLAELRDQFTAKDVAQLACTLTAIEMQADALNRDIEDLAEDLAKIQKARGIQLAGEV